MDSIISVSGWLAMTFQFACVLLAYPAQIYCLKKARTSEGVSLLKWWIIVLTHTFWFPFLILTKQYFVLAPNVPGFIFSVVILVLIYQKRAPTTH